MKTIVIEENRSNARSLIEASPDPLVTISPEGKITDVNEALAKVMGFLQDELIGTDFSEHFTEPGKAREGCKLVFKKGFVLEYPLAIRHKNGKLTNVLCNATVYKDEQEMVLGVVAAVRDIRHLKRTSKYALSLFEASLDPLFTISPEGKITDINEAAVKVTGVTREKLIGAGFSDYFTKPQKAREVYQKVFAKGSVTDCPLTLRHNDGKLTDVLFNGSVYNDEGGNVLGAVIVARDVTAQDELIIAKKELVFQNAEKEKRADELIIANKELAFQDKEKEKRADELIIANKELAFQDKEKEKRAEELIIANKELVFQNEEKEKRAEELIIANKELAFQNEEKEKRADELIIANKELAFQNDEKEKRADELIIANKELAFQNEEKEKRAEELIIANKELLFQNEEKEKRAAELFIANKELVFQTGEKEKRAAELVVADIELDFQNKEKEKREIANKELEAFSYSVKLASQYSLSLIEASLDPLVTISTEGKITDMNEATVNITGITREKLTGTDFFDYFTEPQKAREVYQEVFAKGSVADSPLTLRHKNGKLTDVLFNGSVYKDDRGDVRGVVIVARDVTAQKLQEVKINTLNEELEQRIIELESFSYSVSHDLRAPLRGIDGFIAMFLDKYLNKVDDEGQRLLSNVRRNVTKMGSLIDELLTLSRIGMKDIQITSINMKELALTTLEELSEIKGKAKVTVGEIATAKGDIALIKQVLVNLVSNALKYSNKKEHPEIEIGCELNGTEVNFYVKDNGVGFDMEYSNKLFGVFQRLHDPQEYQGTGVGLAIVKRIITRHGGKVWAEGKVNEGAIFYFSLKKD